VGMRYRCAGTNKQVLSAGTCTGSLHHIPKAYGRTSRARTPAAIGHIMATLTYPARRLVKICVKHPY
jgi:hypothetical protein